MTAADVAAKEMVVYSCYNRHERVSADQKDHDKRQTPCLDTRDER